MPEVRVQPAGLSIQVDDGETLAEAAWRQGYRWPTTCWGRAECMVCVVVLVAGEEVASPAQDEEVQALRTRVARHLQRPQSRLACRLRVSGDGAVVEKLGVRPPAP